jgi:pilus assembly protein CpaB
MNKRFISVVIFALIVAGGATLLFYRLVASRLSTPAPKVDTHKLLVAYRNLEEGTSIKKGDISSADWAGPVPPNAIMDTPENWKEMDGPVIGRGVVMKTFQGEPLLQTRLAPKGAGAGLAAIIPPGKRAVAVRVNEIIGVAGFVLPGMLVDVIILGTPPGGASTQGTLSKTLLQKVRILSAGQDIRKDNEGKPISVPVITMLVDPAQAEILALANSETRIQLVLRNPLDTDEVKTPGTAMARLFGGQAPPEALRERPRQPRPAVVSSAPKPKPPISVEVIQGGQRSEKKFQEEPED